MPTFEQLKQKADELKTKRDQALGVVKNIEDGWEQKYGTRDVKVLKEKVKGMESELEELNADFNNKLSEAEKILEGK
jgi:seryl-tRNA synthetase